MHDCCDCNSFVSEQKAGIKQSGRERQAVAHSHCEEPLVRLGRRPLRLLCQVPVIVGVPLRLAFVIPPEIYAIVQEVRVLLCVPDGGQGRTQRQVGEREHSCAPIIATQHGICSTASCSPRSEGLDCEVPIVPAGSDVGVSRQHPSRCVRELDVAVGPGLADSGPLHVQHVVEVIEELLWAGGLVRHAVPDKRVLAEHIAVVRRICIARARQLVLRWTALLLQV